MFHSVTAASFIRLTLFRNPFHKLTTNLTGLSILRMESDTLVSVCVKPLFGTEDEIRAAFTKPDVPKFHSILFRDKFAFVRFAAQAEAELFAEQFNGSKVNGVTITAEVNPRGNSENSPPSRRLCVSGYGSKGRNLVTERDIWGAAAPHGFVRRISYHKTYSFVDYDTVEEATRALHELERTTIHGRRLSVCFARTIPRRDVPALSINLDELVPPENEFWTYLADCVHFRREP